MPVSALIAVRLWLLRHFAAISLVLGAIGIVLPILPTTPFLLLAAFCFTKSSKRMHRWLCGTSLYQKHLDSYVQNRAMTLKTKLSILIPASIMLLFPMILVDHILMRLFITGLLVFKYWYFFFCIKTIQAETAE